MDDRNVDCLPIVTPEGYADAVRRHSVLNNGIGRNYIWLSDFLGLNISTSVYVRKTAPRDLKSWVVQYPIAGDDDIADAQESSLALTPTLSPRSILSEESTDNTGDSFAGERRSSKESSGQDERRKFISFSTHKEFSASIASRNPFQSTVTFLHGYTSPAWINHIGAGYNIDPEFFCRHLDFRGPEESPISFSIPSIPSSCCYLIDLPVITIGERDDCTSSCTLHEAHIEALRREAAIALDAHRREIKYIDQNRPKMVDGQSMVRDYYVFDETHFAVEQRISICMERPGDDPTFQCKYYPFEVIPRLHNSTLPRSLVQPD